MVHKVSVPFYIIGILFIVISIYFFYDYLSDYTVIRDFDKWEKREGAKIKYITTDTKQLNIFANFPLLNLIGSVFLPGKTNIVLVEYEYEIDGEIHTSRDYDLLGLGYPDKLDLLIEQERLDGNKVSFYLDPTGKRTFLKLNSMNELGLPLDSIVYLAIGVFFIYGAIYLPKVFDNIVDTVEKVFFVKFGVPLDVNEHPDGDGPKVKFE